MNTKSLVAILLVLAATESRRYFVSAEPELERSLRRLVSRWRGGREARLPRLLALPPLNRIEYGPLNIKSGRTTLDLSNVYVTGLEALQVEALSASSDAGGGGVAVAATLYVPRVYVRSDYYHLVKKGWFGFNQEGMFKVTVCNVRVEVSLRLTAGGVRQLELDYSAGRVYAYLSGSGTLVTPRIRRAAEAMLRDKDTVIREAETAIEGVLNDLMAHTSPTGLVDTLNSIE